MKLQIERTLGIINAENRPGTGADSGGGRPQRKRQDEHSGMRAGGTGAGKQPRWACRRQTPSAATRTTGRMMRG